MGLILTPENYPPFWSVFWSEVHSLKMINSLPYRQLFDDTGSVFITTNPENGMLEALSNLDEALEHSYHAKSNGFDFDL